MRFVVGSAVLLLAMLGLAGAAGGSPRAASKHVPRNGLIAYESDFAGPLEIYVMNPDGTKKRRLTHSRQNGEPRWSPDGRRIVFVHGGCSTTGCSSATRSALWIMNADGSAQRRLTGGKSVDNDARWSPDGKWIAFTRGSACTADGCRLDVWLIRPDGTGGRPLTHDGRSSEPTWSPDGKQIALSHDSADGSRSDISVMNADGTHLRNLTTAFPAAAAKCSHPAWSPDGKTIVFSYGFPAQILVFMGPSGVTLHSRVFRSAGGDYYSEPAWSPDSTMVVFQSQQTIKVVEYPPTTRRAKTLAFDGDNHNPDWQPLP